MYKELTYLFIMTCCFKKGQNDPYRLVLVQKEVTYDLLFVVNIVITGLNNLHFPSLPWRHVPCNNFTVMD